MANKIIPLMKFIMSVSEDKNSITLFFNIYLKYREMENYTHYLAKSVSIECVTWFLSESEVRYFWTIPMKTFSDWTLKVPIHHVFYLVGEIFIFYMGTNKGCFSPILSSNMICTDLNIMFQNPIALFNILCNTYYTYLISGLYKLYKLENKSYCINF